jgi:putative endonuclease
MQAFVYILKSLTSGRHYVGSTTRPERRLQQHNNGLVSSTRNKGPWIVVALHAFDGERQARKAEAWVKRQKSAKIIQYIIRGDIKWPVFPD